MAVSDSDVQELLALLERGSQAWINGDLATGDALDAPQDEDMTIFGPFGGPAGRGPGLLARQKQAARLFKGGTGAHEVVKTVVSGDVAVLILIERNEVTVEGSTEGQPWVLRTTQVFEKRPSGWVRMHRHADPLIDLRPPAATFALARGE
jgi:ketosteroid isomerase-like protein